MYLARGFVCFAVGLLLLTASGCVFRPLDARYPGPEPRPQSLEDYYRKSPSSVTIHEEDIRKEKKFFVRRIRLQNGFGKISVDYYKRTNANDRLILVFPILGGNYFIENYFAEYFVRAGYDAAIIHRNNDIKNPDNIDRIEELFRLSVVQDRVVLDYFEEFYEKKQFAGFGLSRGAINLAATAGVDERLRYNVLALGGEDLVKLIRKSNEKGIKKFRRRVMEQRQFSEEEFYQFLLARVKTDPKYLARYIDARNTLLILSVFDSAVPFEYGMQLRQTIGKPDTIFLASGHYTSLLYTQIVPLVPPVRPICIFPFDYIETEAVSFFNRSFKRSRFSIKEIPIRIFQLPVRLLSNIADALF